LADHRRVVVLEPVLQGVEPPVALELRRGQLVESLLPLLVRRDGRGVDQVTDPPLEAEVRALAGPVRQPL